MPASITNSVAVVKISCGSTMWKTEESVPTMIPDTTPTNRGHSCLDRRPAHRIGHLFVEIPLAIISG